MPTHTSAARFHEPNISYAQMAKAYGMYSEGPDREPEGPGLLPTTAPGARPCWRASLNRRGFSAALRRQHTHGEIHPRRHNRRALMARRKRDGRAGAGTCFTAGSTIVPSDPSSTDRRRQARERVVREDLPLLRLPRLRWSDGLAAPRSNGAYAGGVHRRTSVKPATAGMPKFPAVPEQDLADVYAYVRSIPVVAPPVDAIPLLKDVIDRHSGR